MKIAIDALGIHYYGGGRTATLQLLHALFELDKKNQYLVALSKFEPSLQRFQANVQQWIAPVKSRVAVRLWAQLVFPFRLKNYDLIHFTKNLGVFGLSIKQVVTVYDMTTLLFPEFFPALDVWYWKHIEKRTLQLADRVIAISKNTAKDVVQFYHLQPEKIEVIYPAHAPHFKKATQPEIERVRHQYHLPEQFIVHVGRIDRKKNLPLLLEAFSLVRKLHGYQGKLVLVGEEYNKSRDTKIPALIGTLVLQESIIFMGPLPDEDLPAIFGAASLSIFCSRHEGFGIVALEAMASGSPLITTKAGAVVEAVGNAAVVLDVEKPELLATLIQEIVTNPLKQEEMCQKGLERASMFSWKTAAQQTQKLYQEVTKC